MNSSQPKIIGAACEMIVSHGPDAAREAERRAHFAEDFVSTRAAMLWKQVAISIKTIEDQMGPVPQTAEPAGIGRLRRSRRRAA